MKKKIGVLALVTAIAVSMANFSASAENACTDSEIKVPFEFTAEFMLPAVDVTFPTSIAAAINPYHLNITSDGWAMGNSGITSPEYEITNNSSEIGIMISAKLSAVGSGGVNIVTADWITGEAPVFRNDGTEPKQVFAFLNTTNTRGIYANSNYTVGDKSQLAFTEIVPDKAVRLMKIDELSSGFFRIQGDVVETPETNWNAGDSVTFNIIFDTNPYYTGTNDESIIPVADSDDITNVTSVINTDDMADVTSVTDPNDTESVTSVTDPDDTESVASVTDPDDTESVASVTVSDDMAAEQ